MFKFNAYFPGYQYEEPRVHILRSVDVVLLYACSLCLLTDNCRLTLSYYVNHNLEDFAYLLYVLCAYFGEVRGLSKMVFQISVYKRV